MPMKTVDREYTFVQWNTLNVSRTCLKRAREEWRLNKLDRALEFLRMSISMDPGDPEVFVLLAIILALIGRNLEARQTVHHALRLGGTEWSYAGLVSETLKKIRDSDA